MPDGFLQSPATNEALQRENQYLKLEKILLERRLLEINEIISSDPELEQRFVAVVQRRMIQKHQAYPKDSQLQMREHHLEKLRKKMTASAV